MPTIPPWILPIIRLFITIGSPYLLGWIKEKVKNLPADVIEIINELIKSLLDPKVDNASAKRSAKAKLKECRGVACPTDVKHDK